MRVVFLLSCYVFVSFPVKSSPNELHQQYLTHNLGTFSSALTATKDVMSFNISELAIIVEMAMALGRRYFAVCTVILHPYDPHHIPRVVFIFIKLMSLASERQVCVVAQNFVSYPRYLNNHNHEKCPRTMNIIIGAESQTKSYFSELTFKVAMAGPLWLIILNEETPIAQFLQDDNLPFDTDVIVAQLKKNNTVVLHEAYRAALYRPVRVLWYGFWTFHGLVSPPHVSLFYRRHDFEGIVFNVSTTESYPVVSVNITKKGQIDISGYFANVWKDLESRLNFTSVYLLPKDNSTGMLRNGHFENGSQWSGVIGMVLQNQAQVGVASIIITPEGSSVVDFLRPLITTRNNLFFKKPGLEIRWNAIFRPFETGVWVTLLVWILLGSVFLRNVIRLGAIYDTESEATARDFTIANSFFSILRAFSQQGTPKVPDALPGRILVITSYLISVVVLTAYSGALISFIAVQIPRIPFDSLSDLNRDPSFKVQVVKDTAAYMYFANASDAILNSIFEKMDKDLPLTMEQGLNKICNQHKLIQFGPQAAMDLIVQKLNLKGCNIMALPNALNTVYMSVIIQKKNQYRDALNHHLDLMSYQGLLGRLRKQLWPTLGPLVPDQVIEVQPEQVVPIYMVLLSGVILATCLLVIETFSRPRKNRSYGKTCPNHLIV